MINQYMVIQNCQYPIIVLLVNFIVDFNVNFNFNFNEIVNFNSY